MTRTLIGIHASARAYLRYRASELMVDACIVSRGNTARVVYDPTTRQAHNAAATVVYTGKCRLWEVPSGTSAAWQDGEIVTSAMYLSLPFDAAVPEPEDIVKMTVSDDPTVVGRYLQVISITRAGGMRGSRRFLCQYVDSSKVEW